MSPRAIYYTADSYSYMTRNNCKRSSEALRCPICWDQLVVPLTTPCGHTFCAQCIRTSLNARKDCPVCRVAISTHRALRDAKELREAGASAAGAAPAAASRAAAPARCGRRCRARASRPAARARRRAASRRRRRRPAGRRRPAPRRRAPPSFQRDALAEAVDRDVAPGEDGPTNDTLRHITTYYDITTQYENTTLTTFTTLMRCTASRC